jgi:hypothetical protein
MQDPQKIRQSVDNTLEKVQESGLEMTDGM